MAIVLFTVPILVGIALLLLARWARRRNEELNRTSDVFNQANFASTLRRGNVREASRLLFVGNLSGAYQRAGRLLMWAVILVVSGILGLTTFLLANR